MSRFVEIATCPICDSDEGTTFYEENFDARPVSEFIAVYYGGRIPKAVVRGEVFRIKHCAQCDFYWHERVLDAAAMAEFYDQWIDPEASRAKQEAKSISERMHLCMLTMRWLPAAEARARRPRVLDIGGGWGTYALCARALGCDAYVLESSPARLRYAEGLGLRTVDSFSKLEAGSFDLAVMNQSLEHIPRPVQVLEQVRELLKPGGGVAISVPRAHPGHPVLAKGPFQPLEHVNGFTQRALRGALARAGLRVTRDYSRYAELSPRGLARAAFRNLKLRLNQAEAIPSEGGVACFARRPRSEAR